MHTTHFTGPLIKFGVEPAWQNMGGGTEEGGLRYKAPASVDKKRSGKIWGRTKEGGLRYKASCFC